MPMSTTAAVCHAIDLTLEPSRSPIEVRFRVYPPDTDPATWRGCDDHVVGDDGSHLCVWRRYAL